MINEKKLTRRNGKFYMHKETPFSTKSAKSLSPLQSIYKGKATNTTFHSNGDTESRLARESNDDSSDNFDILCTTVYLT